MSQLKVSELLSGTGCILTTRNHIAMRSRKCFSVAVDGVVRKIRAFVLPGNRHLAQGCQVSRMAGYKNTKLVDMHLAYGLQIVVGQFDNVCTRNDILRGVFPVIISLSLHQSLAETGSFKRAIRKLVRIDFGHRIECVATGAGDSK